MGKKLTIELMQELAEAKGGECLSKEYIESHTKLEWRCAEGHTWSATPNSIKIGTWCPYCAKKRKHTMEDVRDLAKERGGESLSTEYISNRAKLRWRCKKGHEWEANYDNVRQGHWCKICAGLAKGSIEQMRESAKERGGECLSEEYVNIRTKLEWQCSKGHTWWARPHHIKQGSWCPECAGKRKREIPTD